MSTGKSRSGAKSSPRRANLLVELGVEELPPRALKTLGIAFAAGLARGLAQAGMVEDAPDNHRYFATPRRLAALIYGVAARQPARVSERRGPSLRAAYDAQGKPSRAARGFAESCGVEVAQLGTLETGKGAWLVYRQKTAGATLAAVVTDCLEQSVRPLPVAKRMRWGDGDAEFVRPVRWLLALHGARVVKTRLLGLKADRFTRGHRFHAGGQLAIPDADAYAERLESEGKVIADFDRRREVIETQIEKLVGTAKAWKDAGVNPKDVALAKLSKFPPKVEADPALLDLVTGMVEWPEALLGGFEKRFLKLPAEVLVSAMRDHQKYFHLTGCGGGNGGGKAKLLPVFIAVSNIASKSRARVRRGNERVLRARLADAEFFWHGDLKTPLEARVEDLKGVLFHHRLGSLHAKTARVVELAGVIAEQLQADPGQTARAAWLCKADLVTDLVGEFPELQGCMGRHYAKKSGEDRTVADALEQHYWPRYSGDQLPRSPVAQSVAVADRIDSLAGLFAAGEIPGGDKDPFALRRAALGVLRILIEKELDLDLYWLLQASGRSYENAGDTAAPDEKTIEQVFEFILERLKAYYQPKGYRAEELAAVMACKPRKPLDFDRRLRALSGFFKDQPEAADSLAAANKRIAGILGKSGEPTAAEPEPYDESLLRHAAETDLARQLDTIGAQAHKCFSARRYDDGFAALSRLKAPVDSFFDEVLVMDEDAAVRNNRLALLRRIRRLFLEAADISLMRAER